MKNTQMYNIYYKSMKINKYPLTEKDINNIKKNKVIYKQFPRDNRVEIPVNKLNIIKCTII